MKFSNEPAAEVLGELLNLINNVGIKEHAQTSKSKNAKLVLDEISMKSKIIQSKLNNLN